MQTRYPMSGAYSCAADLYRALMAAAAYCEPAPDWIPANRAHHWTPDASILPEWRPAGPDEAAEFCELAISTAWESGQWVNRLTHTPETARPVVAMHGPTRPKLEAPRITFAFQPGPGARASFSIAGTHARLQSMADQVRKHWAMYGGGPVPAEIAKPKGPRKVAAWPASALKAWRIQLQEPDHVGAMLTADNLGAAYYLGSGSSGAFCLAGPVQVAGFPDGFCSALRHDGAYVVSHMPSGRAVVNRGAGSRARAEALAMEYWTQQDPEKLAAALVRLADDQADTEAGRAAWCRAHGIEDPAAPEGLADDVADALAVPKSWPDAPAPVAPDPAPVASVKAASDALAALSKDWPRAGMRSAAIRAGQLGHAFALADLQRAAQHGRGLESTEARAALAAAGHPVDLPAPAAPRAAGPLPPPVAPIEGPPVSTNRGDGQALPVASLYGNGAPDPRNSAPLQNLDGFTVGDAVDVPGRTCGRSTVNVLFLRALAGFQDPSHLARIRMADGRRLDVLTSELRAAPAPAAPAWMDAPRAAVYRAHVATARTAEELAPGPCGPCLDNPRQWLRRPGLAPAAQVSAVMLLRLRVARAVLKARAKRRTGPPPALDLLATVATSRSASARQDLALQAAGWIRTAADGWIDLTPRGRAALQAAGFTWRSRGGWMADGAEPDPPPSAPIGTPPDSTSLERPAAPDLAAMRAAGEMAERLATLARAAAGPDLQRQARMLRSEARRVRAAAPGMPSEIRQRWAIAADMLGHGADCAADALARDARQVQAPGGPRRAGGGQVHGEPARALHWRAPTPPRPHQSRSARPGTGAGRASAQAGPGPPMAT